MPRVTVFPGLHNSQGRVVEFDSLRELITEPHRVVEAKDKAKLFSPTEFHTGYRNNKNALQVHFGVVDFDHLTAEETMRVLMHVDATGVEFAFYTTFNHNPDEGDWRFRLAVPFAHPVLAEDWTLLYWPRLAAFLAPPGISVDADPQCKDPARWYYEPSCPAERAHLAQRDFKDGYALDLSVLGGAPLDSSAARARAPKLPPMTARPALRKVTADELRDYVRSKLRKRTGACALSASECLRLVLKGEAWGDKNDRNERLSNACYELVKDFPTLDPEACAQHFAASCSLIRKQDSEALKYTVEFVATKLREKVRYVVERQRQYAQENHEEYLRTLDLCGFEAPYSPEEMAELEQMGVHPRGWILQQESGAWIYTRKSGYLYVKGQGTAKNAAAENLLPARPYGVRTERMDKQGELKTLPLDELVKQWGNVPDQVVGSLVAQRTVYARNARTLTVAECPLRPLEAKYDGRIARWLELIGGAKHEQLLNWIAWVTYLDRPCAMLVIAGHTGVGKSLLGNGIARLWHTNDATPLVEALDNFNGGLAKCPLLFADEKVPRDREGKHRFDDMRELLTKKSFVLNEKNIAKRTVEGSVRVIVGVNSLSLLVGDTPESSQELNATLERIVHVTPNPEAVTYLAQLREKNEQWLPDAIAQHALFLKAQRPLPASPPRFLFEPMQQVELANAFVASSGLYGAICYWLISFLREPRKLYQGVTSPRDPAWRVKVSEHGFYATPDAIYHHWLVYADKKPMQRSIQHAWVGFKKGKSTIMAPGEKRVHTDLLDIERLIIWCEEHTVSDRNEIIELLESYITENVYGAQETRLAQAMEFAAGARQLPRAAAH